MSQNRLDFFKNSIENRHILPRNRFRKTDPLRRKILIQAKPACRASRVSLDVQCDGYVRLLVWRSADRYWLQEKRQRCPVSRMQPVQRTVWDSDGIASHSVSVWHDGSVEVRRQRYQQSRCCASELKKRYVCAVCPTGEDVTDTKPGGGSTRQHLSIRYRLSTYVPKLFPVSTQ